MGDLVLDLSTLDRMLGELDAIAQEFSEAKTVSQQLGEAVGHDGLAHKVEDFSTGWDIRRHKISEAMQAISASIKAIHDTFQQIDGKLADVLTKGA